MPSFDYIASNHKHGSAMGGGAYSKIFAIFNKQNANTPNSKSTSAQVVLKEGQDYEQILKHADQSGYTQLAGTDLSSIFYPFETSIGASGNLPGFDRKAQYKFLPGDDPSGVYVRNFNLMPFHWNPEESGSVYIRSISPSGDGMASTVSGPQYYGDTNEIRDPNSIRSIGLRLPLIGVGWGYSTEGEAFPHQPSGSISQFKGNPSGLQGEGYHVNPKDYIAAPIDFRYDKRRNVWTAGQNGFWAQIIGSASGLDPSGMKPSGIFYSWQEILPTRSAEIIPYPSGGLYTPLSGYSINSNPSFEMNKISVPSGAIVWLNRTREDSYQFVYGASDKFLAQLTAYESTSGLYSWKNKYFYNGGTLHIDTSMSGIFNLVEERNLVTAIGNIVEIKSIGGLAPKGRFANAFPAQTNVAYVFSSPIPAMTPTSFPLRFDNGVQNGGVNQSAPILSISRKGMTLCFIDDLGTMVFGYPVFTNTPSSGLVNQ